jgi:transposase
MKEISRDQRNCIISLLRDGKSVCFVAQKVDVSKSTIKRFGKEDCGDCKVSKGSRPRLIQGADERYYVVRKITKDSTKSAKEVSKTLIGDAGIRISA